MSGTARVVLVTTPTDAVARDIARAVVGERLAACGNVLPALHSIYRWQGAVEEAGEALLLLKTVQSQVAALTERVVALHPYELPEVISIPVDGGLAAYLEWIEASTMQAEEKP